MAEPLATLVTVVATPTAVRCICKTRVASDPRVIAILADRVLRVVQSAEPERTTP